MVGLGAFAMRKGHEHSGARPRGLWWGVLAALVSLLFAGALRAETKSLLDGRSPTRSSGVDNAAALTDNVQAQRGGPWNTELSTLFGSRSAFVEYDLGSERSIDCVYLQGDNNDTYIVSGSPDGQRFRELWVAGPDDKVGMRSRSTCGLAAKARVLKVSARGGDGSYALSELQVFETPPTPFPPKIQSREGTVAPARLRNALLLFGVALAAFLAVAVRGARWFSLLGVALIPLAAGVMLFGVMERAFPVEQRELSLLRSVMAAVALFALVRERLLRVHYPAHRGATIGVLCVAAGLSAASFYNLGRPQFWDAKNSEPELVHQLDMRIYYPFAKYFDELGYDGVYQASIQAYVEDVPGASLEQIGKTDIRNLKDHEMQRVSDVAEAIRAMPERFTKERWASFKEDMGYFRAMMGERHYLATHHDHGANATPVWVAMAQPFFVFAPASDFTLILGGLLDPVLLGLMFLAVGFTFGVRQALLGVLIFGATDLYMFGTNWAGATLRHDWIAYMGLGACALKRERYILAGSVLALAVMIRAFPGIALAGVGLPCLVAYLERWYRERRLPNLVEHLKAHPAAVRVTLTAIAFMVLSVLATSALYSFSAWVEWWKKITLLDAGIGTNDVSLRALVAFGTDEPAYRALKSRMPLYIALIALYVGAAAIAARRVRLEQAALIALPLILVIFNPANYYAHFICLLPLLGHERSRRPNPDERGVAFSDLAISGPLLALCVAEYWTVLDPDYGRHFQYETVLTFAALGWLYYNVLRSAYPVLRELESGQASPETP